jgi:hypothetical protein
VDDGIGAGQPLGQALRAREIVRDEFRTQCLDMSGTGPFANDG